MKTNLNFLVDRYEIQHKVEENFLKQKENIWYITDVTKGRYGTIIAKFWLEGPAKLSLEYLNHKKKLRNKRKVRNGA